MALHPDFPESPYVLLRPEHRWFPAAEELRETAYEKLLPPLVANIRMEVNEWREAGYAGRFADLQGAAELVVRNRPPHRAGGRNARCFRYYFAQREAVETVIWLYDVRGAAGQVRPHALRCVGRGIVGHVRRGVAAIRREDGDRRRQDQGAVAPDSVELLPQAL